VAYHDAEWGRVETDPRALWECLMLEGFQAGLSWITILRRRETFRAAFHGFDPAVIATWTEPDILRLLADPGIIRHRGKIEATIRGAKAFLRLQAAGGFVTFLHRHAGPPLVNHLASMTDAQGSTPASTALSKALKKEGFGYCGPTITYAFMQAVGLVNDHLTSCHCHPDNQPRN
jgi:DNA-3-methyladenine glycosylase I